ncbi:MAG: tRNA lysidine(34) synthetase TilS [Gemmatimonadota bacterium]|nr:tRNA lysidine(34) synthetase TilS [Gemmatimonadota bacterium]
MSGSRRETGLAARFRDHLRASGRLDGAGDAVVAVSGGIDSMTLLHLLRFGGAAPSLTLHAAHLDHGMRPESAADAAWLGETCAAWGVAYHLRAAPAPVRTEAEGRELRYGFLAEVAAGIGPDTAILTGHTADDQAETVLFRIARGSGPRGLGAIRPGRSPSPVRPLLPFWRAEVGAYAAAHGVPHREDPSNRDLRWTRNRLRHEVLPALEAAVPGTASALVALAAASRLESAALDRLLDDRIAAAASARSRSPLEPSFDREALAALPDPVLTVLLRRVATRLGGSPGRGATASLLRFVREAPSGRKLGLAGGVTVEHHLGVLRFGGPAGTSRPPPPESEAPPARPPAVTRPSPRVRVDPPSGRGAFAHGACRVAVDWRADGAPGSRFVAHFAPGSVRFPLDVRPWAPGDRMTLPYGKKKVKKILLEARVPADRREGWPVVADAGGSIVWVPGSARPSAGPGTAPQREWLRLEVTIRS